jgi:hypothetical protein
MSANPPSQQRTEIVTCTRGALMAPSVAGNKMAGERWLGGCFALPA